MRQTIHLFLSFVLFFCLSASTQTACAQTSQNANPANYSKSENEGLALQKKAESAIPSIDWAVKMRSLDARKLENLEKWHQFPLGKMIKQNASISRQDLTTALQAWYNEKPADRAKIILSFE